MVRIQCDSVKSVAYDTDWNGCQRYDDTLTFLSVYADFTSEDYSDAIIQFFNCLVAL